MFRHVRLQRSLRLPPPSSLPLSRHVSRHRSSQLWMLGLAPCGAARASESPCDRVPSTCSPFGVQVSARFARASCLRPSPHTLPFRGSCMGTIACLGCCARNLDTLSFELVFRSRSARILPAFARGHLRAPPRYPPLSRVIPRRVRTHPTLTKPRDALLLSRFPSRRSYALDADVATFDMFPFRGSCRGAFVRIIRCIRTPRRKHDCLSTLVLSARSCAPFDAHARVA